MAPLLILCLLLGVTSSAKILLLPVPHPSHVTLYIETGRHLKARGHDIWIVVGDSYAEKARKEGLNSITYAYDDVYEYLESVDVDDVAKAFLNGTMGLNYILYKVFPHVQTTCESMLADEDLMSKIRDHNFNLAIVDATIPFRGSLVILYKYNIQYISLTPQAESWALGVTAMPSAEPLNVIEVTNDMTFTQRFINTVAYMTMTFMGTRGRSDLVQKYVAEKPAVSLYELFTRAEMWLVTLETNCIDYPRVSAPHYKYIGGASVSTPQPLPDDLGEWMGNATDGVVLVTFGSFRIARAVVHQIQKKLFSAFSKIKQRVILQIDPSAIKHDVPSNVKCMAWVPQNDILSHSQTRAFVTHGGNNGQIEAIYHGVPVITLPVAIDQAYNGLRAQVKGYGIKLDTARFTSDDLLKALNQVIEEPRYRNNVRRCSEILQSLPSAHDKVFYWVEHILRFGGKHLRPPSLNMTFMKAFNLDIFFAIIALIIVILLIVYYLIKTVLRLLINSITWKEKED